MGMSKTMSRAAAAVVAASLCAPAWAGVDQQVDMARMQAFKATLKAVLGRKNLAPCSGVPQVHAVGVGVLGVRVTLDCAIPDWYLNGGSGAEDFAGQPFAFLPTRSRLTGRFSVMIIWQARLNGTQNGAGDYYKAGAVVNEAEIRMANEQLYQEARQQAVLQKAQDVARQLQKD